MRMTADSYTCTVLTPSVYMSTVEATCTALSMCVPIPRYYCCRATWYICRVAA